MAVGVGSAAVGGEVSAAGCGMGGWSRSPLGGEGAGVGVPARGGKGDVWVLGLGFARGGGFFSLLLPCTSGGSPVQVAGDGDRVLAADVEKE